MTCYTWIEANRPALEEARIWGAIEESFNYDDDYFMFQVKFLPEVIRTKRMELFHQNYCKGVKI